MNRMSRFFYGRNGPDQLAVTALAVSLLLYILSMFQPLRPLSIVSLLLIAYVTFRMLSKNVSARQRENAAFQKVFGHIPRFFRRIGERLRGMKTHRYYKCPGCRKQLRVPRGKGKVIVRCPQCSFRFTTKT